MPVPDRVGVNDNPLYVRRSVPRDQKRNLGIDVRAWHSFRRDAQRGAFAAGSKALRCTPRRNGGDANAVRNLLDARLFVASQTAPRASSQQQIAPCVEYDENLSYCVTASMLNFCSGASSPAPGGSCDEQRHSFRRLAGGRDRQALDQPERVRPPSGHPVPVRGGQPQVAAGRLPHRDQR